MGEKLSLCMFVLIYISRGYFPGQELAPSRVRRVASGFQSLISRHFFINQNLQQGLIRLVLLPNNVSNVGTEVITIQILFFLI